MQTPTETSRCPDIKHHTSDITHHSAEGVTDTANGDEASIRAATMLPAQLLQPGEIIVLLIKPSPLYILLAPLKTLTVLFLLTVVLVFTNEYLYSYTGVSNREWVLMGVVLISLRLAWQFVEWLSRVYVLTDQRVIRVRGVLRVSVFECRLAQIQQTDLSFNIRERLFGLGTIGFATAGTAFTEAYWTMIANPLDIHQQVVAAIKRYRR